MLSSLRRKGERPWRTRNSDPTAKSASRKKRSRSPLRPPVYRGARASSLLFGESARGAGWQPTRPFGASRAQSSLPLWPVPQRPRAPSGSHRGRLVALAGASPLQADAGSAGRSRISGPGQRVASTSTRTSSAAVRSVRRLSAATRVSRERAMAPRRNDAIRGALALALLGLGAVAGAGAAVAQKAGGTLHIYNTSQPPSASIHEESTIATNMPFMAIFNNLVRFDAHKPRNAFDSIVPELAERWAWDASGTKLSFTLRSGVPWDDGKPFTPKDVACTWHR